MKRLGILGAMAVFCVCSVFGQDNGASSTATTDSSGNTTTTTSGTTNSGERDAAQDTSEQSNRDAHKAAAKSDENSADQKKEAAKNQGTKAAEYRDKVEARLDDAAKILNELLAAPDNGIPDKVFEGAKCVAVVPSLVKGGFVFGAEHGRGVATCRTEKGWSAPAFFTMTGGSWGAQIGGQAVDLVMLIMNDQGMKHMLDANFNFGGDATAAAGPVGRDASATTDWKFKSEVLTYSRARGLFIGAVLKGVSIRPDDDSTVAFYGRPEGFRSILTGQVPTPVDPAAKRFLATVRRSKAEVSANAH
jgi:lipid-binding SYLF domain-containing protein